MGKETKKIVTIDTNEKKSTTLINSDGNNISITKINSIESEKMGYQPTDKLDTSKPPSGNFAKEK